MEEEGEDVEIPACSAPFLLGILLEIGPALSSGMGLVSIGWRDIEAWQHCTSVRLPPWQSQMLVRLSREYVASIHAAEKPDCRPPWEDEAIEDRRDRVARKLEKAFRAMMNGKG